jgi:hypothetical protein
MRRDWEGCSDVNEGRAIFSLLNDLDAADAEIAEARGEMAMLVELECGARTDANRYQREIAALRKCARMLMNKHGWIREFTPAEMHTLYQLNILDDNGEVIDD